MKKISDAVKKSGMFNFPQIDSDVTAWLIVDGKEYEISQFNISFGQSVDFKGQPQSETRGGRMFVTLTEALPENLYRWAMTSAAKNGEVTFKSKTANAPLKVEFQNAFCINFARTVDTNNGLNTDLVISPEEIMINGTTFDNRWVK
ncbi:hypothetical protein FACS189434_13490 [Bacteroidia bacterium]|nr:hypothetical protein FACS189434_13490 [Bacteroidia bacterium]